MKSHSNTAEDEQQAEPLCQCGKCDYCKQNKRGLKIYQENTGQLCACDQGVKLPEMDVCEDCL